MREIVSFMHTSLDGLVAGPNGEMDWIHVDDEIFDYAGHMTDEADTALYGRTTFEIMESYWPTAADKPNASKHDKQHAAWYKKVEKIVLSKTMQQAASANTRFISDNIATEIGLLKQQTGSKIVIFGSPGAVHSLMQLNLIDEFWLFVNPVIIGTGVPMFKNITDSIKLKLLSAEAFSSGVNGLHYAVERNGS
jgi:dihydrofolate reductase